MNIKSIPSQVRLLYSSGNEGANKMNAFIALNRVEGVGGLNLLHKVHSKSSAKNSLFTKHYENTEFFATKTSDGINITGLHGTDYPNKSFGDVGKRLVYILGTSFSTPIRAAKLALNEMMKDIL